MTPVSSPTPDEQAAETRRTCQACGAPTYAHASDCRAVLLAQGSEMAEVVDLRAALVVVREQLTQAQKALRIERDTTRLANERADRWQKRCEEARAEAASAEARIAAVLALHVKVSEAYRTGYEHHCNVCITMPDDGDYESWPCATVQAAVSAPPSPPTYTTEGPTPPS